ncbi:MAG: hypothetical protein CL565_06160 [Alphaproteobacteria bacterium]|nr:hypothetical protein [Alphaproteobacteria bacterium]
MLRSMRHGALSGVFLVILLLGGVGLVMMDWSGTVTGSISSNEVAKVGGTTITGVTFDRILRTNLRSLNMSTQDAYDNQMIERVLDSEINRMVLAMEAHELGVSIPDKIVADEIRTAIQPLTAQGMTSDEALTQLLQSTGMSHKGLVQTVRRDMSVELLSKSLNSLGIKVPDSVTRDLLQVKDQNRTVSLLSLPHDRLEGAEPEQGELESFYETIKARYTPPETRDLTMITLSTEELEKTVVVSDEDIQNYYNSNKEQFAVPETRKIEQAILKDEDTAMSVLNEFKSSGDMEQAVIKITGNENAYIGSESFEENGLLDDIASVVFSPPAGEIVGPVQTGLGWHVFEIEEIYPETIRSVDQVSDRIRKDLTRDALSTEILTTAEQLDDMLAGGASASEIQQSFPVELTRFEKVSRSDLINSEKLPDADASVVADEAFQLYEGESTIVSELSDGTYFTMIANNVYEPEAPSLSDMRDDVLKDWQTQQKAAQNFSEGQSLAEEIRLGDNTLEQAAETTSGKISRSTITRTDTPPAGITQQGFLQLFTAKQGDTLLLSSENGIVIAKVMQVNFPDPTLLNEGDIRDQEKILSNSVEQDLYLSYLTHLREKYDVEVNMDLINSTYGPQEEVY